MCSRQSLLGLSIAFALLLHGTFLVMASSITLYHKTPAPELAQRFRVQMRESIPEPPPPDTTEQGKNGSRLATRPGAIEELLKQESAPTSPPESALNNKAADVPLLSDRLASESLEREHDLEPDPASLSQVDAKIIEISQETARQNIEIARRLVSPSSDRILGENEFPVLRGKSDTGDAPITVVNLLTASQGRKASSTESASETSSSDKPPFEKNAVTDPLPDAVSIQADVMRIARAPIVKEIKKESPYEFMDDVVDVNLETYFPPQEKIGFFRLRIIPRKDENIGVLPKDITFVIDSSTSIPQHKLDASVKAVKKIIPLLRPDDHFNIIVFRDTASSFRPDLVPAMDQNKSDAVRYITGLQSGGVTDVYNALRAVVKKPPRKGVPGIILVISDGKPTSGVRDARTIINTLTEEMAPGNSVFTYSCGNAVNRYLLELLAYRNKGETRIASSIGEIEKDLPKFLGRTDSPVLVHLNADYGSIPEDSVFPKDVPDFYKDKGVVVYGRFDPAQHSEFTMRLTGNAKDKKKEVIFKTNLKKAATGDEEIARNWAFERIYFLIGEICRSGEKPELLEELRALSRKYGIITSYDQ